MRIPEGLRSDLLAVAAEVDPYTEMHERALEILSEWKKRGQKNYGEGFLELGARGQYSELHRKMIKLRRSVWDVPGTILVGEEPTQVAAEMISHCLMLIYCLERGV